MGKVYMRIALLGVLLLAVAGCPKKAANVPAGEPLGAPEVLRESGGEAEVQSGQPVAYPADWPDAKITAPQQSVMVAIPHGPGAGKMSSTFDFGDFTEYTLAFTNEGGWDSVKAHLATTLAGTDYASVEDTDEVFTFRNPADEQIRLQKVVTAGQPDVFILMVGKNDAASAASSEAGSAP